MAAPANCSRTETTNPMKDGTIGLHDNVQVEIADEAHPTSATPTVTGYPVIGIAARLRDAIIPSTVSRGAAMVLGSRAVPWKVAD